MNFTLYIPNVIIFLVSTVKKTTKTKNTSFKRNHNTVGALIKSQSLELGGLDLTLDSST